MTSRSHNVLDAPFTRLPWCSCAWSKMSTHYQLGAAYVHDNRFVFIVARTTFAILPDKVIIQI
jgi:hypothetical protein